MVGHSHGGGEVTHFLGKHGSSRVRKAVLIGAVPPLMVKTEANPEGTDLAVFDSFRASILGDRAQFFWMSPAGPSSTLIALAPRRAKGRSSIGGAKA